MWWLDITSPAARWVCGLGLTLVVLPTTKWVSKLKKDKKELVQKVDRLEEKINSVGEKLDMEVGERRLMEEKMDKHYEKIGNKFDKFGDALNQVVINTAVNSAKIDK